mmetsp:Transcript_25043/g.62619  ORF Transcript_25043/g.62619 Transcript_25043/m.62619 type:complete len:209 (-) Transcript_25043:963-1589(-)
MVYRYSVRLYAEELVHSPPPPRARLSLSPFVSHVSHSQSSHPIYIHCSPFPPLAPAHQPPAASGASMAPAPLMCNCSTTSPTPVHRCKMPARTCSTRARVSPADLLGSTASQKSTDILRPWFRARMFEMSPLLAGPKISSHTARTSSAISSAHPSSPSAFTASHPTSRPTLSMSRLTTTPARTSITWYPKTAPRTPASAATDESASLR